jgi:hypothetical protein
VILPEADLGLRIAALGTTEDMRVACDHLVGDRLDDVAEGKGVFFLGHACVKDHLEQEISEFLAKAGHVAAGDGIGDFVGFLDRVGRDGGEILLDVPRAAGSRIAQTRHEVEETVDRGCVRTHLMAA